MSSSFERSAKARWLALSPTVFVIGIFMGIPILIMVGISFLQQDTFGGVKPEFSYAAYRQLVVELDFFDNLVFDPAYLIIIWRSVYVAALAMIVTLVMGFPMAYYITRQPPHIRNLLIFLITVPLWTNLLIRIFAWLIILGHGGPLDLPFRYFNPDFSLGLLYTPFAIVLGLAYVYLPLMVLPIYASLEKLDFRLVEAASDLYASKWSAMRHVVIPLAKPGIAAGCILVFVPALGDFIVVTLLGGAKNLMLGSLIQFQFQTARNWPFGAALSVVLLAFVIAAMVFYAKLNKGEEEGGHP
jgi:spermidine/putrescine transport system permease protein